MAWEAPLVAFAGFVAPGPVVPGPFMLGPFRLGAVGLCPGTAVLCLGTAVLGVPCPCGPAPPCAGGPAAGAGSTGLPPLACWPDVVEPPLPP